MLMYKQQQGEVSLCQGMFPEDCKSVNNMPEFL